MPENPLLELLGKIKKIPQEARREYAGLAAGAEHIQRTVVEPMARRDRAQSARDDDQLRTRDERD